MGDFSLGASAEIFNLSLVDSLIVGFVIGFDSFDFEGPARGCLVAFAGGA